MKKINLLKKSNNLLKYWITVVLIVILIALIRQNFFIHGFPKTIQNHRDTLAQKNKNNQQLKNMNQSLLVEVQAQSQPDMEILESQARFRFGLIKPGETYYQIGSSGNGSDTKK